MRFTMFQITTTNAAGATATVSPIVCTIMLKTIAVTTKTNELVKDEEGLGTFVRLLEMWNFPEDFINLSVKVLADLRGASNTTPASMNSVSGL